MIFFVPVSFILMVLLCIVAAGYAVIQNIGAILATIILICVFLFFFFRWPAETFGALLAMGIIGLVCMSVSDHWDEKK